MMERKKSESIKSCRSLLRLIALIIIVMQISCAPGHLKSVIIKQEEAPHDRLTAVKVIRDGKVVPTELDMGLKEGDEIKTNSKSTAILSLLGGTEVILKPNTRIRLVNPFHRIFVYFGELYSRVKGSLSVETVHVAAGTEGTEFLFSVTKDNNATVVVIDGTVKVTSRSQAWEPVLLRKLEQASARGEESPAVREVSGAEFNTIIQWVNEVEKIFRKDDQSLLVPEVTGLHEADATKVLTDENFRIRKVKRKITGKQSVGTVLKQSPASGNRVSPGRKITLTVEAEPVHVPVVVGLHRDQAIETLRSVRLSAGKTEMQITGDYPKDTVIRQEPEGGAVVPVKSKVNLWIEEESVLIPDVTRLHVDRAREILAQTRLRTGRVDEELTGDVEAKTVKRQHPSAGVRVGLNASVNLVIEGVSVLVPDVTNLNVDRAREILNQEELRVGKVEEEITGNRAVKTVSRQYPDARSRVRPGTSVNLVIEGESVVVPNVLNQHVDYARDVLQSRNLRVGRIREELREGLRSGTVLHQGVREGTLVRPRTQIDLVVAEQGVRVPEVIGMSQSTAELRLRQVGLRRGRITRQETNAYGEGSVMRQYPSRNELVKTGSRVDLVIAEKAYCRVPDVRGYTYSEAQQILAGSRLKARYVSGDPGYKVIRQEPAPGTRIQCGDTVNLWIQIG